MSSFPNNPGTMSGLKPHRGTTVLVLGICGFLCFICGIIAFVMGQNDLKEMDAGVMDRSGRDLTNIGRILGLIFTILAVLGIVVQIVLMVLGVGLAAAGAAAGGTR